MADGMSKTHPDETPVRKKGGRTIALYPGSFDPFTNGHLDMVDRACEIFDELVLAIAANSRKTSLFTVEERQELMQAVMAGRPNVRVTSFTGLTTTFAREVGASVVVRGIRAVTDFDYEHAMYQVNRDLAPDVETVFLLSSREYTFLSSTIIKEIARFGKVYDDYAPPVVNAALLRKFGPASKSPAENLW